MDAQSELIEAEYMWRLLEPKPRLLVIVCKVYVVGAARPIGEE